MSVCCTATQPPKGPATALLRHRTVQMFPVEAPVQARLSGMATVMLKSSVLACERPLTPGTLLVTVRFCDMTPVLPVILSVRGVWKSRMGSLTRHVNIASIGSSSIGVHLVDCDSHQRSSFDLCNCSSCDGCLGILSNIDIAAQLSPSTLIDNIRSDLGISNDGCVLLARRNSSAIPCNGRVD